MAVARRFVCEGCGKAIEAWSDGNPYFIDETGAKEYAYHPDHDRLEMCIGNDSPHLCLDCGETFEVDSLAPVAACPGCGSADISDCYDLEGRRCPSCKAGQFVIDPDFFCIS